jgi:hypothetical protein
VPAFANVLASELGKRLESSEPGHGFPVQLVLSLLNGALVAPVEVHVPPPAGAFVSTTEAAVVVPLPVIVAVNAASVGVVAATSATARLNRINRRTRRPLGRRSLAARPLTAVSPPAPATAARRRPARPLRSRARSEHPGGACLCQSFATLPLPVTRGLRLLRGRR